VVLHTNEVGVEGARVEAQTHERIDRCGLVDAGESPGLLISELDEIAVVDDDLVTFVLRQCEQLGEGKPLAGLVVVLSAAGGFSRSTICSPSSTDHWRTRIDRRTRNLACISSRARQLAHNLFKVNDRLTLLAMSSLAQVTYHTRREYRR
jgi:hypothetical protein